MVPDHEHGPTVSFCSEGAQCHMPLMPVKFSFIEDSVDSIIKSEFCSNNYGLRGSRLHYQSVLLLTTECQASVKPHARQRLFLQGCHSLISTSVITCTVMDNLTSYTRSVGGVSETVFSSIFVHCTGRHCWTTIHIEKQHSDQLQRKTKAK